MLGGGLHPTARYIDRLFIIHFALISYFRRCVVSKWGLFFGCFVAVSEWLFFLLLLVVAVVKIGSCRYDSSVQILALLSICFVFMALTHLLGVSNELGYS